MYLPWRASRALVPLDLRAGFRVAFVRAAGAWAAAGALTLDAALLLRVPRFFPAGFIGNGPSCPLNVLTSFWSGFRASASSARVDCSSARSVKIGRGMEPPGPRL